jgi:uncharacterized linocin/CFP29 family protein
MAEYTILVKKDSDKSEVMSTFSNITDPLVASQRVFSVELNEEELEQHQLNSDIESIEEANPEFIED